MPAVLVSGTEELVTGVGAALRQLGVRVTEVLDLADMPRVCAEATERFDAYVQLPSTFQIEGSTAIDQAHHFYADGVLARFPALAAAVPVLAEEVRLIFVMGRLPKDVSSFDDRQARRALVDVLIHAVHADVPRHRLITRITDSSATPERIAAEALGRATPNRHDRLVELTHDELRIEMYGLGAIET